MSKLINVAAAFLLLASNTYAHHSSAPHYDHNNRIELIGTYTEMKYVNPHAYIYFDVDEEGTTNSWRCELSAASTLTRRGWSADMFTEGQKLTIAGSPARREDNVCFLNTLQLEDGTTISRNQDITGLLTNLTEASAETSAPKAPREKTLSNGQPNLSGAWVSRSFGRNGQGIRPNYQPTDAGKLAAADYDIAYDDPIIQCHYLNLINGWNHDVNINEISQTDDAVTLQYGFMDVVRTIHLNISEHPTDLEPSATGHSIGHWENNTLVVDTIGFEAVSSITIMDSVTVIRCMLSNAFTLTTKIS